MWQISLSCIISKFPFYFLFNVVHVSDNKKLRQKTKKNARFLPGYVRFEFAIFNFIWKDLYGVEFADNSRLNVERKAKNARRLWRPKQMTASIANIVIWGVVFWESVLHAQWRTALPIQEIWTTADTKNSWFFKMAANKADLTTNFNRNLCFFLITKSSICLGKIYAKMIKIWYLFKFWSATFDPHLKQNSCVVWFLKTKCFIYCCTCKAQTT